MGSDILDIRRVRATRRGFKINFNLFAVCCDFGVYTIYNIYEGFPIEFGFKLGASCPLLRGAGGIADVWMC